MAVGIELLYQKVLVAEKTVAGRTVTIAVIDLPWWRTVTVPGIELPWWRTVTVPGIELLW